MPGPTPLLPLMKLLSQPVRGVVVAADAGWDAEDFVVALDARIPHVKGALCTYKTCIQKLNDKLFKGKQKTIAFDKHEDVARSLKAVSRQVDHMLDSAFRSGVQAALSIAKSWYPGIDLQLMTALREGSEESIGKLWTQICHID